MHTPFQQCKATWSVCTLHSNSAWPLGLYAHSIPTVQGHLVCMHTPFQQCMATWSVCTLHSNSAWPLGLYAHSIPTVHGHLVCMHTPFQQCMATWSVFHSNSAWPLGLYAYPIPNVLLTEANLFKIIISWWNILNIRWPENISNEQLWDKTKQTPIETEIRKHKWGWIGHTLRKPASNITRQALDWNPQGQHKVGRLKQTWRRSTDAKIKATGTTWAKLKRTSQNRVHWRGVVAALCSTRSELVISV